MFMTFKRVAVAVSTLLVTATAFAGIVVHTSEVGVGKFHRKDNQVHPYQASAWSPYILPDGAASDKMLVQKNADGSYSIFYSTLSEMLSSVVEISKKENQKVSVINVHGHGLPGAMWFPANQKTLESSDCYDWRSAASGSDDGNYDQYYSPVPAYEILSIRQMSDSSGGVSMGCTTGLKEWQQEVAAQPAFLEAIDADVQVHFLSCVVGLGKVGDTFTNGIAALLVRGEKGRVQTSTNFGLGDWSMPEGMGFWDYITDAQLEHDNNLYPTDRKDREIMQKGVIRVSRVSNKSSQSGLLADQDFMKLSYDSNPAVLPAVRLVDSKMNSFETSADVPDFIRIPGTRYYAPVLSR